MNFKRFTLLTAFLLLSGTAVFSQVTRDPEGLKIEPLSAADQFFLSRIPALDVPPQYKSPSAPLIPYMVDNSTQPYFRPITWQTGYECGQSAGIAFNFTYEIDRLRNLPANTGNNQYPTHFTWDFLNNADNYHGASCLDSWEIVRACGNMNVTDYGGGLGTGGYLRWITGYDVYYNGMANRINYNRTIRVGTEDGLRILKYWIFDHLEGSPVGGVANLYGQYFTPTNTLPPGTPEAGKYVQTFWGASPSHTWTICGYNDSIRYDYNGDGHYTNNLDINNDGIVDMRDWEIGGLKIASGYAGTGWGNSGFCYVMYKTLADNIGYGGIWDHSAFIINVKPTCSPKLTMKVTLKHTSRNMLKVTAGVSTDLSALVPAFVEDLPIFNYQGGDHYMTGGTAESDKTIEFGIDLTPLLNKITPGQNAKYFLQVQEADPGNTGTGEIVSCSLMDYTSASVVEVPCSSTHVPIANNTITRVTMTHAVNFTPPQITTTSLPTANLYQFYSYPLSASGGTTPYLWDAKITYPQTLSTATFPAITDEQLVPNSSTGYVVKTLPFNFPFYDKYYNKLYINRDGFVVFEDMRYTWPYLVDKWLLFRETPNISLFYTTLSLYASQGDNMWYKADFGSVTIRWKASLPGMPGSSTINLALKLYRDGKIEFYFGNMVYPASTFWTAGISSGDNKNYQNSLLAANPGIPANSLEIFSASGYPTEMHVSEDGNFSGTPTVDYQNVPVVFRVTDLNNLSTVKTLLFSTNGLLIDYTVNSGGDSILEFGETAMINLIIHNIGGQAVHNVNTWMSGTNNYISLTDSSQYIGNVNAGQIITVNNAFSFHISPSVPDQFTFPMMLHVSSTENNFTDTLSMEAYAPVIFPSSVILLDGDNGRLDPGETTDMQVTFINQGKAKADNVNALISSLDPFLIVNNGSASLGTLGPDSSRTVLYNITGTADAPFQHLYRMNQDITANNGFNTHDTLPLFSGEIIEDFETGDFSKFPWQQGGYASWYIVDGDHYEGTYSARSGFITDNQESCLYITINVIAAGPVSFWKKVSCENDPSGTNYDYLAFFIDNTEMGRWDGIINWTYESFNVTEGFHTLKWVYHKDYSLSAGSDCAWIDFISFPDFEGALPVITASPASFDKALYQGQETTDYLAISNIGGNYLEYSVMVFDTAANKKKMAPANLTGSYIECFTEGFVPGLDFSWTFMLHHLGPDIENIKHVKMDFPPGIVVNSATDFTGGSLGDLIFMGSTGNGASLNWHGETANGKGVVKTGETALATISGTVQEPDDNDLFIVYSIRGDSSGSPVHSTSGYDQLVNFGLPNNWLTVENNTGTLPAGGTNQVTVHFNTQGLAIDNYSCNLVARDVFNNKIVIPVVMHVLDSTTIGWQENREDLLRLTCYPNPFSDITRIEYYLGEPSAVTLEIFSMAGTLVRKYTSIGSKRGTQAVFWDGTNENGVHMPPGVYSCRLRSGNLVSNCRLILIN